MNVKKLLLLFLGLGLPVLVFLFLKLFGKNQFDVPLIHPNGVKEVPAGCNVAYGVPYILSDSLMGKIVHEKKALNLVNFDKVTPQLADIAADFASDVSLTDGTTTTMGEDHHLFIKKCILLIQSPATIVMIDSEGRIRGYYDGNDRDELDRLEAELQIILKKY